MSSFIASFSSERFAMMRLIRAFSSSIARTDRDKVTASREASRAPQATVSRTRRLVGDRV